jgi:hypothetical protein
VQQRKKRKLFLTKKWELNMRRRPDLRESSGGGGGAAAATAAEGQNKKDKEEKWRTCNLHVTWSGPIYLLFFFFLLLLTFLAGTE